MTNLRYSSHAARRSRANSDPLPHEAPAAWPPARKTRPVSRPPRARGYRSSLPPGMRPPAHSTRFGSKSAPVPGPPRKSSSPSHESDGAGWAHNATEYAGRGDGYDEYDEESTLSSEEEDEEDNFPLPEHRPKIVPELESRILDFERHHKTLTLSELQRGYQHVQISLETALDRSETIIDDFSEIEGLEVKLGQFEAINAKSRTLLESKRRAILSGHLGTHGITTSPSQHQLPLSGSDDATTYEALLANLSVTTARIDSNLAATRQALVEIQDGIDSSLDQAARRFESDSREISRKFHKWARGIEPPAKTGGADTKQRKASVASTKAKTGVSKCSDTKGGKSKPAATSGKGGGGGGGGARKAVTSGDDDEPSENSPAGQSERKRRRTG